MQVTRRRGRFALVGSVLVASAIALASAANASTTIDKHHNVLGYRHYADAVANFHAAKHSKVGANKVGFSKTGKAHYARGGGDVLQCVPFARAASGIEIKGNAVNWWDAAAGVYDRGSRPEPGSVLNFRANGHMRLGHVAVVRSVVGPREIEIDHANWSGYASKSNISRRIPVIDVSETNDWSAVRVGLGRSGDYGSVYSTYGFIYDRPDSGQMVANTQAIGRAPLDRPAFTADEVAEAPMPHVITPTSQDVDAPDHSFR